jgi:hypothetical protein
MSGGCAGEGQKSARVFVGRILLERVLQLAAGVRVAALLKRGNPLGDHLFRGRLRATQRQRESQHKSENRLLTILGRR